MARRVLSYAPTQPDAAARVGVSLYVLSTASKMAFDNKDVIMATWTFDYYNAKVAATIEDWLADLRASFLRIAELMDLYGPDPGMPHTRAMGGGLFEMRPKARAGIGRILYCVAIGQRIVLLHAFIKKTERTPPRELSLAYVRAREVKHDCRSL